MRILTVRQPWAHAIIHFGKDVENRPMNIAGEFRGLVAIHAARLWDDDWRRRASAPALASGVIGAAFPDVDFGAIIGVVELTGAHRAFGDNPGGFNLCGYNGQCSKWAEPTGWHLTFARPRALDVPIPYKGALGMRKVPFEVIGDVLAERVNEHTCGTGPGGHYGAHEPGCGLEPVGRLGALT